jgi:rubrerythrin
MEISKVLDELEKLEKAMATTYEWMAEIFDADEGAAAFFIRMARDEVSHANLVKYERRLVRADPDAFASRVDVPPNAIGNAFECIAQFRRSNPAPTLVQVLRFALKMEADCAESLHREVVLQANPNLGALIGNLAKADVRHYEQLERFIAERSELFD